MRVVIDARPALEPRGTGVTKYVQQLIRHLPYADPDSDFVAWYLHARGLLRPRRFFDTVAAPNLTEHPSRFPARVFQPLSWRARIPRLEWLTDFDLVLAANFVPPATGHPERAVLVIHDLAFDLFPETAPHIDARWRRRFAEALEAAPAVIVPSMSAKQDILAAHQVADERVHVVHHGVDAEAFAPASAAAVDAVRDKYGIRGRYALFLGGIEPRKNLERLVEGFGELDEDIWLVIAGGPVRWHPKAGESVDAAVDALGEPARTRVVCTGYISDRDRVALLTGATALAYPSLYEGFGFPVLEAFAAGVPVLTSNVASLPEVAGDAAVLVDPLDSKAIAAGLAELFGDEDLRAMLSAAGLSRSAKFTWEATARGTAAVLRAAAQLSSG